MKDANKEIISHADNGGKSLITCPGCGISKKASVSKFKGKKHKIITRCKCGEQFSVQLNFRAYFRKEVSLRGEFKVVAHRITDWFEMEVGDLSRTGIGLRKSDAVIVKQGDKLKVKFHLDNHKKTLIEKMVVVKIVNDQYLGCEFIDLAAEEKELGFYLFV